MRSRRSRRSRRPPKSRTTVDIDHDDLVTLRVVAGWARRSPGDVAQRLKAFGAPRFNIYLNGHFEDFAYPYGALVRFFTRYPMLMPHVLWRNPELTYEQETEEGMEG